MARVIFHVCTKSEECAHQTLEIGRAWCANRKPLRCRFAIHIADLAERERLRREREALDKKMRGED